VVVNGMTAPAVVGSHDPQPTQADEAQVYRLPGGMMERYWLRSYDPESDHESWSNPVDIHTIYQLKIDVERKGHMTRVYTEAEMVKRGWTEQSA
jgi:hypothetical protein